MICKKCKSDFKSQVVHLHGTGYFNVIKAIKIIQDKPRVTRKLSKKELSIAAKNGKIDVNDKHLDHVDITVPGILGRTDKETFILDGNHRVAKAKKSRKSFSVFELTEFETGQVFRKNPPNGKTFI
jgi:hypothetical protein